MSGIFGIVDPPGVETERLREVLADGTFRGDPVVRSPVPGATVGAFVRPGDPDPFLIGDGIVAVADARVHGSVFGEDVEGPLGERPVERLEAMIRRDGVAGLNDLAAEFAFARIHAERKTVLLVRDAFGHRPLHWATRDGAVAFASDAETLIRLGFGSPTLDRASVRRFLAGRDLEPWRSPFVGIRRVPGGRWISLGTSTSSGRWFRPEDVSVDTTDLDEAARAAEVVVRSATTSIASGRVALVLSGGRDSGALAVALERTGIAADAYTYRVPRGLGTDEAEIARRLAERCGHRWLAVDVDSVGIAEGLERAAAIGGPFGPPVFTYPISLLERLERDPVDVVIDGMGGEPLFESSVLIVLDLLRRGRFARARAVSRAYRERWLYPAHTQVRAAVRALAPPAALAYRERFRRTVPWLIGGDPLRADALARRRTGRSELIDDLIGWGAGELSEVSSRVAEHAGAWFASPLLDLRVVRLALRISDELRAPGPDPKPVLQRAFLDDLDEPRVKGRYAGYVSELAERVWASFPWGAPAATLTARHGFIDEAHLSDRTVRAWPSHFLRLAALETWLRREDDGWSRTGRRPTSRRR